MIVDINTINDPYWSDFKRYTLDASDNVTDVDAYRADGVFSIHAIVADPLALLTQVEVECSTAHNISAGDVVFIHSTAGTASTNFNRKAYDVVAVPSTTKFTVAYAIGANAFTDDYGTVLNGQADPCFTHLIGYDSGGNVIATFVHKALRN